MNAIHRTSRSLSNPGTPTHRLRQITSLTVMLGALLASGAAHAQLFVTNVNGGGATSGTIGTYSTSGSPSFTTSGLNDPTSIAIYGPNLYVTNADGGATGFGTVGEYTMFGGTVTNALVRNLTNPSSITVSGSDLYVASKGTGVNKGTIGEYDAITGLPVATTLVSGLNQPAGVAAFGSSLFVTSTAAGTISEYNATTGQPALVNPVTVTGLRNPTSLIAVADASNPGGEPDLIFTESLSGIIAEYRSSDHSVSTLVSGLSDPTDIALSGNNLFVTNDGAGTVGEYLLGPEGTSTQPENASLITGLQGPSGIALGAPVPLPTSVWLMLSGLCGLGTLTRKKSLH